MTIIQHHSTRPAADDQGPVTSPAAVALMGPADPCTVALLMGPADPAAIAQLMGPADPGTVASLMGPADLRTVIPLMGHADAGTVTPLMAAADPTGQPEWQRKPSSRNGRRKWPEKGAGMRPSGRLGPLPKRPATRPDDTTTAPARSLPAGRPS
jgi:hypothetical protein